MYPFRLQIVRQIISIRAYLPQIRVLESSSILLFSSAVIRCPIIVKQRRRRRLVVVALSLSQSVSQSVSERVACLYLRSVVSISSDCSSPPRSTASNPTDAAGHTLTSPLPRNSTGGMGRALGAGGRRATGRGRERSADDGKKGRKEGSGGGRGRLTGQLGEWSGHAMLWRPRPRFPPGHLSSQVAAHARTRARARGPAFITTRCHADACHATRSVCRSCSLALRFSSSPAWICIATVATMVVGKPQTYIVIKPISLEIAMLCSFVPNSSSPPMESIYALLDPDHEFLFEAISALVTFHLMMGIGKWEERSVSPREHQADGRRQGARFFDGAARSLARSLARR